MLCMDDLHSQWKGGPQNRSFDVVALAISFVMDPVKDGRVPLGYIMDDYRLSFMYIDASCEFMIYG